MPPTSSAPWSPAQLHTLATLRTPLDVQAYLDDTPYSTQPIYRCPARVMQDRRAHCFDGATLAVAALKHHGVRAALLDLRAVRDDDHVLAVYRQAVGLRGQEQLCGAAFAAAGAPQPA